MGDTKVKINIREGTFELEGSETFVERHLPELKSYLENPPQLIKNELDSSMGKKTGTKSKSSETKSGKPQSFDLIPLDLKGGGGKPSLKEFYEQKMPKSDQEIATLFAYYLKHHLSENVIMPGHALFCYNEIDVKKPTTILQVFRNTVNRKKWLDYGEEQNTFIITIAGENLIKHELPHKEKTK